MALIETAPIKGYRCSCFLHCHKTLRGYLYGNQYTVLSLSQYLLASSFLTPPGTTCLVAGRENYNPEQRRMKLGTMGLWRQTSKPTSKGEVKGSREFKASQPHFGPWENYKENSLESLFQAHEGQEDGCKHPVWFTEDRRTTSFSSVVRWQEKSKPLQQRKSWLDSRWNSSPWAWLTITTAVEAPS